MYVDQCILLLTLLKFEQPITKKLRQIDREQNSDLYQRIKDELFM
jgi:hypothetical protein